MPNFAEQVTAVGALGDAIDGTQTRPARWRCRRCNRTYGRRPDHGACSCRGRTADPATGQPYPEPTRADLQRIERTA